jgi:hypothetical protein
MPQQAGSQIVSQMTSPAVPLWPGLSPQHVQTFWTIEQDASFILERDLCVVRLLGGPTRHPSSGEYILEVVNRLIRHAGPFHLAICIMLAALLRRISRLPSQSPIEAITFFFVLVTLVYFQLLQAVQDSEM